MHTLAWIDEHTPLPHPSKALPEGLLAVGVDLSVTRLTEAYGKGIFPWFNEDDPVLWWSPDPRMVLACNELKISHSLAKKLRQIARHEHDPNASVQIHTNTAFDEVIQACAAPRQAAAGTWITAQLQSAYSDWHQAGYVHSVETWMDGELAGGLYGVCLGRFFFGESMFARRNDASKLALVYLTKLLMLRGISHIDCQQKTPHLASLGAQPLSRKDFLTLLAQAQQHPTPAWGHGRILSDGQLALA